MRIHGSESTFLREPIEPSSGSANASSFASGDGVHSVSSDSREPSGFRDYLEKSLTDAEREEHAFDQTLSRLKGSTLNMNELIATQVGVYRFTQHIDLMSRLVDKASGTAKQVLQSQT